MRDEIADMLRDRQFYRGETAGELADAILASGLVVPAEHLHKAVGVAAERLTEVAAERDRLRSALAHLVALKDGPRDGVYETNKPLAWDAARAALADPP